MHFPGVSFILSTVCRCDGMVDVADSKSADGDIVWVRVPPPAPRQKNSASLRSRGLRKSRENCVSAESFFLSETELSWGSSVSVMENGSDLSCPFLVTDKGLEPEGTWRHAGGMSQPEVACPAGQVESHHRHHVRRTQLHSVSAVCVRAAKTAYPLSPSSFPKRSSHGGAPFRFIRIEFWIWMLSVL